MVSLELWKTKLEDFFDFFPAAKTQAKKTQHPEIVSAPD
jgi:hypothetical protein